MWRRMWYRPETLLFVRRCSSAPAVQEGALPVWKVAFRGHCVAKAHKGALGKECPAPLAAQPLYPEVMGKLAFRRVPQLRCEALRGVL